MYINKLISVFNIFYLDTRILCVSLFYFCPALSTASRNLAMGMSEAGWQLSLECQGRCNRRPWGMGDEGDMKITHLKEDG